MCQGYTREVPVLIKLTSIEEDGYKSNNNRIKDSVLNRAVLGKGKFLNESIAHGNRGGGGFLSEGMVFRLGTEG